MLHSHQWNRQASTGTFARTMLNRMRFLSAAAVLVRESAIFRLTVLLSVVLLLPSASFAAVASDAAGSTQNSLAGNPTGTVNCTKVTVGSTNEVLIANVYEFDPGGTDALTNVQYASTTMTIQASKAITTNYHVHLAYMLNPPVGTANVCATLSAGAGFNLYTVLTALYTGGSQVSFPDASNSGTAAGHANIVGTVTTVADNSWLVMVTGTDDNGSCTAGANTTIRQNSSLAINANRACLADSNAAQTPAGSHSLTVTPSATTGSEGWAIISIAPSAAAPTTPAPFWPFFFLSIGPIIPRRKVIDTPSL